MKVTFSGEQLIDLIPHIEDLSKEEKKAVWYRGKDLEKQGRAVAKLVAAYRQSSEKDVNICEAIFNRSGQSLRGLETYIEDDLSPSSSEEARKFNRKLVEEQKRIKREEAADSADEITDRLALLYFQGAAPYVKAAHNWGVSDAEALKHLDNFVEAPPDSVKKEKQVKEKKKKKQMAKLPSYLGA